MGEVRADGERLVRLLGDEEPLALLGRLGALPLPPYITMPLADPERYQTVFADRPGSAAAPTAGLHLTDGVLDRCRERGIAVATVDLEVGLGTFAPIRTDDVEDHVVHSERYTVPAATVAAVEAAERVVAVGTTVVRTLETWAATGRTEGTTDLFIRRGHEFAKVDVLLTNFHVPRSQPARAGRRLRRRPLAGPLRHRPGPGLPLPLLRRRHAPGAAGEEPPSPSRRRTGRPGPGP